MSQTNPHLISFPAASTKASLKIWAHILYVSLVYFHHHSIKKALKLFLADKSSSLDDSHWEFFIIWGKILQICRIFLYARNYCLVFLNLEMFLIHLLFLKFEATPWGLEGVLEYLKQSYNNPPIYILENGTLHSILSSCSVFVFFLYLRFFKSHQNTHKNNKKVHQWNTIRCYKTHQELNTFKLTLVLCSTPSSMILLLHLFVTQHWLFLMSHFKSGLLDSLFLTDQEWIGHERLLRMVADRFVWDNRWI